ncbi:DNA polymerase III subunit delta [Desulfothermobacter acidiphilus]|uniref:DNA polymerase III subunit delta n=1 Tax=Desulfothermobacter acidiphilus TaxID=1938353 RepID=UPI003F8C29BC
MQFFITLLEELKRGQVYPLYLFWGPERYLQQEAVHRFRSILVGEDNPFDFIDYDAETTTVEQVVTAASTLPVLATRRLVVVRNAPYFASKRAPQRALEAYLQEPAPTTCLVFCSEHSPERQQPLFRRLVEKGKAVEFSYLAPSDLLRWLHKQARLAGKSLSPEAGQLLLAAGPGLTSLRQEWEKVLNYAGECREITPALVEEVLTPPPEEVLFRVTEEVGQGHYLRALNRLRLLAEQEPPGVVLTLFLRQLRLVLVAQELLAMGKGEKELAQLGRIPLWVAKKILSHSRRFPPRQAQQLFCQLIELDAAFKSGREDFWLGLERSLWALWLDSR